MTRSRHILPKRRYWTRAEEELLREFYPDWPTEWLAPHFKRTVRQLWEKAEAMGLRKSTAYLASPLSGRLQKHDARGGSTRFKKGQVPANKGLRRPGYAPGRMAETQFKKGGMTGAAARNYRPIGSTRIVYGNLERKITDDTSIYPARRWRPVHRMVWEATHGPVPKGHIIVFKPGMHTTVEHEITLDRLECITRKENMRRNTLHRYPKELASLIQLKGAVQRQINKRART